MFGCAWRTYSDCHIRYPTTTAVLRPLLAYSAHSLYPRLKHHMDLQMGERCISYVRFRITDLIVNHRYSNNDYTFWSWLASGSAISTSTADPTASIIMSTLILIVAYPLSMIASYDVVCQGTGRNEGEGIERNCMKRGSQLAA